MKYIFTSIIRRIERVKSCMIFLKVLYQEQGLNPSNLVCRLKRELSYKHIFSTDPIFRLRFHEMKKKIKSFENRTKPNDKLMVPGSDG